MLRLVSDGIWDEIKQLWRTKQPKFAALAYVTSDAYVKFGEGDILVCDASDSAISAGQTSAEILRRAWTRKASLYSSPGLHAKVLVLGRTAVVGSANMSAASASRLTEAAVVTDDARAVAGARVLVEQLAAGGVSVDERFLERISKIKVRPPVPGSKRRRSVKLHEQRAWLISVHPLDQNRHDSEREVVEKAKRQAAKRADFTDSEHGYIRFIGSSTFRKYARPGDIVMTISLPRAKSTRATVYAPETLLHRKDEGHVTHVFVEEYADREDTAVSFTDFSKLWRSTSSLKPPTRRSTKELDLELAETLRQKMQR